jgi:hypothetical protein
MQFKHIETICTVPGLLMKQKGSYHLMRPSYAGHYVSFKTVLTIVLWTVFQVLVLHIPDGNVFALELVTLSPSTPTQTCLMQAENCLFVFVNCACFSSATIGWAVS